MCGNRFLKILYFTCIISIIAGADAFAGEQTISWAK